MDVLVAGDVYRAEIVLDLLEHVALGRAEGARDFEVDAQRRLPDALALVGACEAARLFEYFVADRLRRLHKDRKSTRLNSSHSQISYAVFCLKKKKREEQSNG